MYFIGNSFSFFYFFYPFEGKTKANCHILSLETDLTKNQLTKTNTQYLTFFSSL